jgi:hypothetical protein
MASFVRKLTKVNTFKKFQNVFWSVLDCFLIAIPDRLQKLSDASIRLQSALNALSVDKRYHPHKIAFRYFSRELKDAIGSATRVSKQLILIFVA